MTPSEASLTAIALLEAARTHPENVVEGIKEAKALLDGRDLQEMGEVVAAMTGMTMALLMRIEDPDGFMDGARRYFAFEGR